MSCVAVDRYGDHLYVVVRQRSWRRVRSFLALRCWRCDLCVREP